MDQNHPLHDPGMFAKFGTAIRDYYHYVDGHLANIVESLDDDTTLIIMSDHGFGPFHKFIHVNNWLIQEELMHLKPGLRSQVKGTLFRWGFSPMNVYNLLMRFGLGALKREVVRGQGQGLLKTLFLSFEDIDWPRTEAYSLGNIGQIRINLVDREPFGCIQPGADYEQVRDRIVDRLAELRDPETGEAVVETVYRREEIYNGPQLEHAPDIVFIPKRLEYFGFGEYEFGSHKIIEAMQRGISGTHRLQGIFLAYGSSIQPGVEIETARIIDLAPTILHLLGTPIPDHMDGRVLHEVLDPTFKPILQTGGSPQFWPETPESSQDSLTPEERELLTERLRSLGYVG
jgi:predicted AlkP superfamily phosphohydrolase/phosphomutase